MNVKGEQTRLEQDEKVQAYFHLVFDEQVEYETHERVGKRDEKVEEHVEYEHEREIFVVVLSTQHARLVGLELAQLVHKLLAHDVHLG